MKTITLTNWKFKFENAFLNATVPGDISTDLLNNNKIENPLFGDNFKKLGWIHEKDWEYITNFNLDSEMINSEHLTVLFNGVDTYASIYVNNEYVGEIDSMFRPFSFNLKETAKLGNNELKVIIHSIKKEFDKHTGDSHYGTFNNERIFMRKVQCHFGWDWAVNFPGTGIYKPVEIEYGNKYRIDDVYIRTNNNGLIGFFVNLNFSNRKPVDFRDEFTGKVKVTVFDKNNNKVSEKEKDVFGAINQMTLKIDNPELWFPNGYGEQPIYSYVATLTSEDSKEIDRINGTFAIREIIIDEPIRENDSYGFDVICNGARIRMIGGNWVPCSPFTGSIPDSKYQRLLEIAKNAGINTLRLWGGGLYELDPFYEYCDKYGILIWQDFMFSCEIVPDDIMEFRDEIEKEATYQIKRLRNHPSIMLWCGGNELSNSFKINLENYGLYIIKIMLPGLVSTLDDKRRYLWNSPYSRTDICNDPVAGDCHKNVHAISLYKNESEKFRDYEPMMLNNFDSECAILGMCRLRDFKKFMPEENLWPQNDLWKERLLSNPFDYCCPDFTTRISELIKNFYGSYDSLEDFIKKSMLIHADILGSEIDYYRAHVTNSGILSWMYNDYIGNGTWSIVDDALEPKAALYSMKRCGKRLRTSIIKEGNEYFANLINDTNKDYNGKFNIYHEGIDGTRYLTIEENVTVSAFTQIRWKIEFDEAIKNAYLYSEIEDDYEIFFYDLWKDKVFKKDIEVEYLENNENETILKIKANEFARCVFISIKEGYKVDLTDNYFDLRKGQETTVTIKTDKHLEVKDIDILTFNDVWEE